SKPFNPDIVKLRVQSQLKIITHARALDEQIECNRELAEHSSRGKSEFLSRMSHEMRTPMNAIIGMMQVIKKRGIPDDLKVYFNEIDTASKQLLCLIDNVLDISGMEYGIFKLSNAVFNIREMFQQVLEAANYNAALKNQIFSSDIDQKLPELLNGDRKRLKQVVDNLLANAVKYTAEQGKISFAARLINEDSGIITLQIEVTDNGIGISAKQQGQIFSIFEQADGSCTREYCGIGVGLPLSKRIASMMGGNILVESELDKGAKFIFTCNLHKNVRVDLP
ncbi:MAG: ATP-binding protein, partial [Lachnospiraceae bacterium]|nr:ATP-binding protein [Lachnospiraceae bacterium]